jgi:transcriptional regulator with XRE-family HTH domain
MYSMKDQRQPLEWVKLDTAAKHLRRARQAAGLSVKELALISGFSETKIRQLELGQWPKSLLWNEIQRIAVTLDVSTDLFRTFKGKDRALPKTLEGGMFDE